jgi:hypothetical protein
MNMRVKLIVNIIIILGLLTGCSVLGGTPPPRNFSTVDLLVYPELLLNDWVNTSNPQTKTGSNVKGFSNTVSGSDIELQTSDSSIDHIVIVFTSAWDAAISYKDHNFTRNNPKGLYPMTWEPLPGFDYKSPKANQFQVVCAISEKMGIQSGELCDIEAQYEEFLSILIYSTTDSSHTIAQLNAIAKAIDFQMTKYLDK